MVQSLANLPIPTPAPNQAIRIQIPAINIDAPVVQGDGWEQLKKGVAQHIGSADPGQEGNVVFSAHNDVYGELFRFLDKLQPGDQVVMYTQQRQYTYIVDRTILVEPTAVEVMASTGSPTSRRRTPSVARSRASAPASRAGARAVPRQPLGGCVPRTRRAGPRGTGNGPGAPRGCVSSLSGGRS